jgi:gluconate 5-dehydrogenase
MTDNLGASGGAPAQHPQSPSLDWPLPDSVYATMPVAPGELFDLSGRTAVVTGGGTHLGRAMAAVLIGAGAFVHLVSRRGELCRAVAAELSPDGSSARGHGCDIADGDAVSALVDGIVAESGRIDVMVCNAGGSSVRGAFTEMPDQDLRHTLDVNIVGTAACARAAARHMIPAGSGSIVLIGSISGVVGHDQRAYGSDWGRSAADYYIAKGAVINMARALAMEWSTSGVRVNCLSPGQIPKPTLIATQVERFRDATALGRVGVPADLMGAVLLLASDAGSFITGQNLVVDGGWTAR